MIFAYEPFCRPCRQALNVYYITCQGCQERRRKALLDSASNAPIPPPSIPKDTK